MCVWRMWPVRWGLRRAGLLPGNIPFSLAQLSGGHFNDVARGISEIRRGGDPDLLSDGYLHIDLRKDLQVMD